MDERLLEIQKFEGEGYRPLIVFNTWRVAILRWLPSIRPEMIDYMERHTLTDEVFVLLKGQATLIIGGNSMSVDGIHPQEMEVGTLYNVRQNTWHTVVLSQDASILLVEENSTGKANTEYFNLTAELRKNIIDLHVGS